MPRPAFYYLNDYTYLNKQYHSYSQYLHTVSIIFLLHAHFHKEVPPTQISLFCIIHLNQLLFQICMLNVEALFLITIYLYEVLLMFLFIMIIYIRAKHCIHMSIYSQPICGLILACLLETCFFIL